MLKTLLGLLMLTSTIAAFAELPVLENGKYTNLAYSTLNQPMFKSLSVETKDCQKGGAVIQFSDLAAKNFCIGSSSSDSFMYKRCVGKMVPGFPINFCLGFYKNTKRSVTRVATKDNKNDSLVLLETYKDDNKVTLEVSYTLQNYGSHDLIIKNAISDKVTGKDESADYIFTKE